MHSCPDTDIDPAFGGFLSNFWALGKPRESRDKQRRSREGKRDVCDRRLTPIDQNNRRCAFLLRRSNVQICLLCTKAITKKDFKRKLTKACLNLELIAGKEISSGEGSLLTTILCRNCADKNETVGRKILARLARFSDAYSLYTSP